MPPLEPPSPRTKKRRASLRGALALAGLALGLGHAVGAGCAAPFDPASLVNSLRILSVQVDRPYAQPGEEVSFTMTYFDGRDTGGEFTPVQIVWLGGCVNPPGNQYYSCYEQLGELFASFSGGGPPPSELVGIGPSFTTRVPEDILTSLAEPPVPPKLGTGFVFFAVCAGELRPVEPEGDTAAGGFPLGCFDAEGRRLGPESFIPGFSQYFVFEDERRNANPEAGLTWNGEPVADGERIVVAPCAVSAEERRKSGCAATDEFSVCTTYEFDVAVTPEVAEFDPGATDPEGNPLREVVWVSYLATGGDLESGSKLVSDASAGLLDDHGTVWVPPEEPGSHTIWAVVRDNRGGSRTLSVFVDVVEGGGE